MKKLLVLLIAAVIMSSFISSAYAASNPGDKLARGVVNCLTCVFEIPKQIDVEWKEASNKKGNITASVFAGLIKGSAYTIGRLCSGAWDIVSFPFKVPENYEPLMKPEFVLDK